MILIVFAGFRSVRRGEVIGGGVAVAMALSTWWGCLVAGMIGGLVSVGGGLG